MNESIDRYDSDNSPYSVRPLPPVLRHGLAAVATMGFISFFTSLSLLIFLSYKLIQWHNGPPKETKQDSIAEVESPAPTDAVFVIPSEWSASQPEPEKPTKDTWIQRAIDEPPNQFLVLIFNLLLADIQQALAFILNVDWLARNAIEVGTGTCWAQGWFVSTGDLASSVFITGIAIHTYMSIVRVKQLPTWAFHTAIAMMWGFVYGTGILGVIVAGNGKNDGGLYVRAGAWCWINSKYQDIRLTLHYLWIFISLIVTTVIYFIVFLHLQRIARSSGGVVPCRGPPEPESIRTVLSTRGESSLTSTCSGSSTCLGSDSGSASSCRSNTLCRDHAKPNWPRSMCLTTILQRLPGIPDYARHHTFLLYPLVYFVCTSPLAAGRLASMVGHEVSLMYFCFAGAMIASNGWLDVVLYSSTRRSIVFSADGPPSQETGLETFAFMCRQPPKFGNTTTVTGGIDLPKRTLRDRWNEKLALKGPKSGSLRALKVDGSTSTDSMRGFGVGDGSVMGMVIQCETVTTVSVEVDTRPQITRPKLAALGRKTSDASSCSGTSTVTSTRSLEDYTSWDFQK